MCGFEASQCVSTVVHVSVLHFFYSLEIYYVGYMEVWGISVLLNKQAELKFINSPPRTFSLLGRECIVSV